MLNYLYNYNIFLSLKASNSKKYFIYMPINHNRLSLFCFKHILTGRYNYA